jgi:putative ABC transport system permease protein
MAVDEGYINTLGIKLVKGRGFSGPADTLHSIVVNENMAKSFGWGDDALGKKGGNFGMTPLVINVEVIGVVIDFNQQSLYNPITPLILFYQPNSNIIEVKLKGGNIASATAAIEKKWKATFPELPSSTLF